jgi:exodeoxyribonuclease VII large subunit
LAAAVSPAVGRAVDRAVETISITELYRRVDLALASALPTGPMWVRGEIQTISDRTGHCYFDLIDPEAGRGRQAPVLKVKCWSRTWGGLRAALAREGIELVPGMVVHLAGRLEFYQPRAEIGFVLSSIDVTALLGRLAAERAALIAALREEGLLEANRRLEVPAVPLSVGLVASPGTEGYRDFVGQLHGSGFAFEVQVAPAAVQGPGAPRAIARAIGRCARSDCDLVVVVRGGGSKADLAAFDTEPVARAIAGCARPVWTGIGHTGDESVADIVANRSFVTPTQCGHELAARVEGWWQTSVVDQALRLSRHVRSAASGADRHLATARGRLAGSARQQLGWHRQRLERDAAVIGRQAVRAVDGATAQTKMHALRLARSARSAMGSAEERLAGLRRLLTAYDVERQLERGYTLTMDEHGRLLRSTVQAGPGQVLRTRFADGTVDSVVTDEAEDRSS